MAQLSLSLLGGFQARRGRGSLLALPAKAQALLAYLAARPGQAHPRDKLAALFWGGTGQEQARRNLRHTLFDIRKAVGPSLGILVAEAQAVALDPVAVDVDVLAFEKLVAQGTAEAFEQAAALYQGELLEGLSVDEPPFEEWLLAERERLRELALEALARLLAHQSNSPATERAIQTAIRLLALDPLQEPAHRTLMRLYARQGRRSAALKQYQVCVGVLRRELGAEPEPETRRLYQDILQQRVTESAEPEARLSRRVAPRTRPMAPGGEGPLIGREEELEKLRRALDEVRGGLGRVVVILGEAGVGKSSLVAAVGADVRERGARLLLGRCYESQQILPFGPWVDALRGGDVSHDSETLQELAPIWRAELSRLLPEISSPDLPAPSDDLLRLFESVAQLVEQLTIQSPLAVLLEDLHWADEMSLRLFAFVARRTRTASVLIAATAREEELASTPALLRVLDEVATESHFVRMPLSPLSRGDATALVRALARRGTDEAFVARLSERLWSASAGNPFIIVETMRALDDGAATETAPSLPLPERVRQVIAGRLGRLSKRGQQLAEVAAVIGREFDFPVLQIAAGLGVRDAAEGVEELVRRRVLHGIGERLDFTHERVREVVRDRLLAPHRKFLHSQLARAVEEVYAENLEPHYAALGLHCSEGEIWEKAATYLRRAGLQAGARSAYSEAGAFLMQALGALSHLPATRQTTTMAIDIRLDLRNAFLPLSEWARMGDHLREAEGLARTLGDQHRLGRITNFMLNQCMFTGDYDGAVRFGREALGIARTLSDRSIEVTATTNLGGAYSALGEFNDAAAFLERNVALEGNLRYERFGSVSIQWAWSGAHLADVLSELGRFDEAIGCVEAVVQIAEEADNPFTLNFGLFNLGRAYLRRGDFARATGVLERNVDLYRTRQVVFAKPFVTAALSVAYALTGRVAEALPLISDAVEEFRLRPNHFRPAIVPLYAGRTYLAGGRLDKAASHARDALELTRQLKARAAEAHALCLAGDVASSDSGEDASDYYRDALALAGTLAMRPLVAQSHLGLGKLYQRTGKRQEAQAHLATAAAMFREMDMRFWLEKAEAV